MAMTEGINIIIPMGGLGSRFTKEGYQEPKPLIRIAGRPMISWLLGNLQLETHDTVFIALQATVEQTHHVIPYLQTEYPDIRIKHILLHSLTRGAAETLHIVTQTMTRTELVRNTISLDCDTLYFTDILARFRALPPNTGCSFYFTPRSAIRLFSYVKTSPHPHITHIAEKNPISSFANTGAYGFPSAKLLQEHSESALADHNSSSELYVSHVIARMLAKIPFHALPAEHFACVGTPNQLVGFVETLKSRKVRDAVCFEVVKGTMVSERMRRIMREMVSVGIDVRVKGGVKGFEEVGMPKWLWAVERKRVVKLEGCVEKTVGWVVGKDSGDCGMLDADTNNSLQPSR